METYIIKVQFWFPRLTFALFTFHNALQRLQYFLSELYNTKTYVHQPNPVLTMGRFYVFRMQINTF